MSRMSSDPVRSCSSAMMKNSGTTTSPCWSICSSAPCAPAASPSAKIPSVMKPSCATDEYPRISRAFVCVNACAEP